MSLFKRMTMVHKGLRYKLLLAFSLMSIIPLLACVYLVSLYIFPQVESITSVSYIIFASILIALLGLFLAKGLVDPVIDMAIEANIIASGQYDRSLNVPADDEVGNLAVSINAMTQKIKSNLDELKTYGQKMKEINTDVHKKVLALSSLLQIGDVISSGSMHLEELLEMAVEKATLIFEEGFSVLCLSKDAEGDLIPKVACGMVDEKLENICIRRKGRGMLEKSLEMRSILSIDKAAKPSRDADEILSSFNIKNILAIPVYSGRASFGMLIMGSRVDNYKFKSEDIELAKVFAKQITIAIENDMLNKRTEDLAIKDDLTDLYNKNFILSRLAEEIKRAIFYQRPCSLVVFGIDDFTKFRSEHGELATEEALKKIGKIIKDNLTPVGKAARIGGDEFAILLPEKNKRESFNIAEEIRKKIESSSALNSGRFALTVSAGVGENPLDGVTGDELFKKAMEMLNEARASGKNKVVI